MRNFSCTVLMLLCVFIQVDAYGQSPGFQPGNLVVTSGDKIKEFTLAGQQVSEITVPNQELRSGARDFAIAPDGKVHVFNGTFTPSLSTWDQGTSTWQHHKYDDWFIVNNGTYGGVAVSGETVYLTDMTSSGPGIVAFDKTSETFSKFSDVGTIDLNLGLDGLLYAMNQYGRSVEVYDPRDHSFVRSFFLTKEYRDNRAVAVDRSSNIYVADWSGRVRMFDPAGVLLAEISLGQSLYDVDVDGAGNVIASDRNGDVHMITPGLESSTKFNANFRGGFVEFAAPQTPNEPRIDFYGTPEDDTVIVDLNLGQITINGMISELPLMQEVIQFFGSSGNDTVVCYGGSANSELAVFESGSLKVLGETNTFIASQSEHLEFVATDVTDVAIMLGTPDADQVFATPTKTTVESNWITHVAEVETVYVFGSDPQDKANYRGTVQSDQLRCSLDKLRVRAISGDSLVVMQGFENFSANGLSGELDDVVIVDTPQVDYLYSGAAFTRIFNADYDYSFGNCGDIFVWSDNPGSDRANFQATPGSQFQEGSSWSQQSGEGFRTSVFNFNRVDLLDE